MHDLDGAVRGTDWRTGAAARVPILSLWGGMDRTITPDLAACVFNRYKADNANVTVCVDPASTHGSIVTSHADYVNQWIAAVTLGATAPAACRYNQTNLSANEAGALDIGDDAGTRTRATASCRRIDPATVASGRDGAVRRRSLARKRELQGDHDQAARRRRHRFGHGHHGPRGPRAQKARTLLAQVAALLPGLVTMSADDRIHSNGKLQTDEPTAMTKLLLAAGKHAALFGALADKDGGKNDATFEPQPAIDDLARVTALQQLSDDAGSLAQTLSDTLLHFGGSAQDVVGRCDHQREQDRGPRARERCGRGARVLRGARPECGAGAAAQQGREDRDAGEVIRQAREARK